MSGRKIPDLVVVAHSVVRDLDLLIAEKERALESTRADFRHHRLELKSDIARLQAMRDLLDAALDSPSPNHGFIRWVLGGVLAFCVSAVATGALEPVGSDIADRIGSEISSILEADGDGDESRSGGSGPPANENSESLAVQDAYVEARREYADALRQARLDARLTQPQVSKRVGAGMSVNAYKKYEWRDGSTLPDSDRRAAIADVVSDGDQDLHDRLIALGNLAEQMRTDLRFEDGQRVNTSAANVEARDVYVEARREYADALRQARVDARLTQPQVSKRVGAGMSVNAYKKYEWRDGSTLPDSDRRAAIADVVSDGDQDLHDRLIALGNLAEQMRKEWRARQGAASRD